MPKSLIQGGIVYKQFCNQVLTPGVNKRSYFPTWKGFVNGLFKQFKLQQKEFIDWWRIGHLQVNFDSHFS